LLNVKNAPAALTRGLAGEVLTEIQASENLAVLLAEQNATWALSLARRGVILDLGRIRMTGEASALLDNVTSNLWALSTSTGQLKPLTDFGDRPIFITRRVSWSSDGRAIFAAVGEGDSDVVLLEGLTP